MKKSQTNGKDITYRYKSNDLPTGWHIIFYDILTNAELDLEGGFDVLEDEQKNILVILYFDSELFYNYTTGTSFV